MQIPQLTIQFYFNEAIVRKKMYWYLNPQPSDSRLLSMTENHKVSFNTVWKLPIACCNRLSLQCAKSWRHLRRQNSIVVGILASWPSRPEFDSQWSWNFFQRNNIQCCRGSSTTTTNSFASSSNELDVGVTGFLLVSCHDLNLDFFSTRNNLFIENRLFLFSQQFLGSESVGLASQNLPIDACHNLDWWDIWNIPVIFCP